MDNAVQASPSAEEMAVEDSDDPQLTIRIPNPKVFMARQSLWVGHRGKLRCDQCRIHNLKCDRQQPVCNQCTWVPGRECKYTPLPTPAHRGVPRCDSCRLKNLKCDRNLPVCDQCEADSNTNCVYSPKRRKKHGHDRDGDDSGSDAPPEAVAQSIIIPKPRPAVSNLPVAAPPLPHLATPYQSPSSVSFSMKHQSGLYAANAPNRPFRRIQPWNHQSFLPLPSSVLQGIASINAAEMPPRVMFETALDEFIHALSPDHLRETACMTFETYSNVVKFVHPRVGTQVSPQMKKWLDLHHYRSGSTKYTHLLMPREATFALDKQDEDRLLNMYRAAADRRGLEYNVPPDDGTLNWSNAYDFVPVRNQMYDIMAYTHRKHGSTNGMMHEITRLNIANITWPMVEIFHQQCPYCAAVARAPPRVKSEDTSKT